LKDVPGADKADKKVTDAQQALDTAQAALATAESGMGWHRQHVGDDLYVGDARQEDGHASARHD
jgi:hypothetical protein